jgi:hypothetical protein
LASQRSIGHRDPALQADGSGMEERHYDDQVLQTFYMRFNADPFGRRDRVGG